MYHDIVLLITCLRINVSRTDLTAELPQFVLLMVCRALQYRATSILCRLMYFSFADVHRGTFKERTRCNARLKNRKHEDVLSRRVFLFPHSSGHLQMMLVPCVRIMLRVDT